VWSWPIRIRDAHLIYIVLLFSGNKIGILMKFPLEVTNKFQVLWIRCQVNWGEKWVSRGMMKLYNHSLQAQNQTGDVYTSLGHFQVSLVKDDETVQSQFTSSKPNQRSSLYQCWAVFYFHEEHPVLVLKNKLELSWFQFHT
jgi:hypothetical protein